MSKKIRKYFEERDQTTYGGKTKTSEEGMETKETHLKERKKERKTILITGRKKEDEFRQFRSKGGKKEKVLGRKADSSYDHDRKEESICGRKTDGSENRMERKSTWKKDRRF